MADEKRTLMERLQQWLFGNRKANRVDQKERRDELATFIEEHTEDKEQTVAAQEKRLASTD